MPRATEHLTRRSNRKAIDAAISGCIETEMAAWKKNGKIGNAHPKTVEEAQKIAAGLCYSEARSKAGGSKVPRK